MARIDSPVSRPRSDVPRGVYWHAVALLVGMRVALWLLPSRVVLAAVDSTARRLLREREATSLSVGRLTSTVRRASRRVPRASCLTQALAGRLLLASHGRNASLRIGVRSGALGNLLAHAWLEIGGRPVLGDIGLDRFVRLPALDDGR